MPLLFKGLGKRGAFKAEGNISKVFLVLPFTAEAQLVHHPKAVSDRHPRTGKMLCHRAAVGGGQLQNQIRPALKGALGTGVFVKDCRLAPLDEIAAHNAYKSGLLSLKKGARLL